ncbi:MAG: hypothetical protein M3P06_03675 [Acidobacteriota bacterium]|nr:hypothetical protein [Acidobacteriota bacterium]
MKRHRLIINSVLSLVIAASAFAHGGHKHQFLGTVKMLHENHLVVTTTEKKEVTFTLTEKTKFSKGANVATKADLAEGVRVSVSVENDGKTATSIKIGPATTS